MKLFLKSMAGAYVAYFIFFYFILGASLKRCILGTQEIFFFLIELYFLPFSRFVHSDHEFRAACLASGILWLLTIYVICIYASFEKE